MKQILVPLAVMAAFILPAGEAGAAVIGTYDFDYSDTGNRSGQGRDQNANGVLISDDGSTFRDSFSFGDLSGAIIESFDLSFTFSGAGPTSFTIFTLEEWTVTLEGSDPTGTSDDLFGTLVDATAPLAGTIDATTAPGSSFFDDALANLGFDFSFEQDGLLPGNSFRLAGASLSVNGTAAVVPLPAPGFLLLAALGGLAMLRRRKTADVVA
ncbi:VPLPA-CTERM sorting domain-containing protein [Jannaschia donghaensis]|uniref:VPLPA-CTERM protein sorting domain protein n=1 Tax=Jannaschia donghaensis TaxID=420998 RepID=A0A0M6YFB2_9RHOB|nr:VPLPA-CTERM sorting domain-containing protein [Jannaschia donghaensis]CTQ49052.1 VPLPA-CTERM protein sorting domain protein [Jannaschia donghaensis]